MATVHAGSLKKRTKTKNGVGKIGAPIRYKNKLYYPDIGDRKAQQALAKRYEATGKKIEKIKRDLKGLMSSQEVKRLAQGGW